MNSMETLQSLLEKENSQIRSGLKRCRLVYFILVLCLTLYLNVVLGLIEENVTPQTVSFLITDTLQNKAILYRNQIIRHSLAQTPLWAESMVVLIHDWIPGMEHHIKNLLNKYANYFVDYLEREFFGTVNTALEDHSEELRRFMQDVTRDDIAVELADIIAADLDAVMETYFNEKFINAVTGLKNHLDRLTEPGRVLTRREDAEKRVFLYWVFLIKYGDMGEGLLPELLDKLTKAYDEIMQGREVLFE